VIQSQKCADIVYLSGLILHCRTYADCGLAGLGYGVVSPIWFIHMRMTRQNISTVRDSIVGEDGPKSERKSAVSFLSFSLSFFLSFFPSRVYILSEMNLGDRFAIQKLFVSHYSFTFWVIVITTMTFLIPSDSTATSSDELHETTKT
jgi:hypothetical protein